MRLRLSALFGALCYAASLTLANATQPRPDPISVAAFNMAWAGTVDDFKRHVEMCSSKDVNWCDTRARVVRGASAATAEEQQRAAACQAATTAAAGGSMASLAIAPCNAYRPAGSMGMPPPLEKIAASRTIVAYEQKLTDLRSTVARLIDQDLVKIFAFQEVKSEAVIRQVLGKHASKFGVCVASHNAFQTLAFAWESALSPKPGRCETYSPLAILDPPNDPAAFRRVRPGLALTLEINGAPVSFLNVHLKAGCASVVSNERFPGRLLTDSFEACGVLNRQVPLLESWIEAIAAKTPRFVVLGDFNRRIDDEAAANVKASSVRADGSDPATRNTIGSDGRVATQYLWQELNDGDPALHQLPLQTTDKACTGFVGLDHIVISDALKASNPGVITSYKAAVATTEGAAIEASDHCPRVAKLRL